jgi:hypothetical protein
MLRRPRVLQRGEGRTRKRVHVLSSQSYQLTSPINEEEFQSLPQAFHRMWNIHTRLNYSDLSFDLSGGMQDSEGSCLLVTDLKIICMT